MTLGNNWGEGEKKELERKAVNKECVMEQVTSGAAEVQFYQENREGRREPIVLTVLSPTSNISTGWCDLMCHLTGPHEAQIFCQTLFLMCV